jgi:hypothetical protein
MVAKSSSDVNVGVKNVSKADPACFKFKLKYSMSKLKLLESKNSSCDELAHTIRIQDLDLQSHNKIHDEQISIKISM